LKIYSIHYKYIILLSFWQIKPIHFYQSISFNLNFPRKSFYPTLNDSDIVKESIDFTARRKKKELRMFSNPAETAEKEWKTRSYS